MSEFQFSDSLSLRDGFLHCEEVKIKELQTRLHQDLDSDESDCRNNASSSSPFFVYSRRQILSNVEAYNSALATTNLPYLIGYSVKANYNPTILRLVTSQPNTCLVAVSGYEVQLATRCGVSGDRIVFNGNGKQSWELKLAVRLGCLVNVDSLFDVQHLVDVCRTSISDDSAARVRILLRLNPDIDPAVHPFLATGLTLSKFGIDERQLDDVLDIIAGECQLLQLVGLHCHLGSTIDNVFVFRESLAVLLNVADRLRRRGFDELQFLNLGGGLGIHYERHAQRTLAPRERAPPGDEWKQQLREFSATVQSKMSAVCDSQDLQACCLIQQLIDREAVEPEDVNRLSTLLHHRFPLLQTLQRIFPHIHIPMVMPSPADVIDAVKEQLRSAAVDWPTLNVIVEPGRSVVGNAGTFVTKVLGWKRNGNQKYIVVDGSMTEVIRPALYGTYHHIELTEPPAAEAHKDVFDVVGPVCECGDFIGKNRWLAYPHENCGLAVFDTGAYCSSMASNYNMRPRPLEVLVDGDQWQVIRRPETLQDLISTFV